jgi:cytochrome P450
MPPGGYTFSDGFHVPHGVTVGVAGFSMHTDSRNYPNPEQFDGLRFGMPFNAQSRESRGSDSVGMTIPTNTYLAFGGGIHPW